VTGPYPRRGRMQLVTDLRAAVDRLQAVPLEDFVAERKRLAKELRDGGDREAAAELAKLPKPSAPAWALNRLAREEPATIGAWIEAAEALRDASTRAGEVGGDAVRAAMAAHREATRSVLAAARDRTRPNGRELSEPMLNRVRDLLQVATLDPGETERLRAGLIVEGSEDEPSLPEGDGAAAAKEGRAAKQRGGAESGAKARTTAADRAVERRAEKERAAREREEAERAELERLVADAEARLQQLRATVAEREKAAAKADERLEEAQRTLHRCESEAGAARDAVDEATDAAEQAERELRKLTAKLSS
jgi:hypothetical protein